jgi:hypothetical protein
MEKLTLPGDQSIFPVKQADQTRISMPTAILLLVKATICTDAFLISDHFRSGILCYFCLLLGVFALTQASFHLYIRTWSFGHAYTYSDIWAETVSASTAWIPGIIIILSYMAVCTLGAWEIQRYTSDILTVLWPDAPEVLLSPWLLEYVLSLIVLIPCFAARKISHLVSVSAIGCVALLVSILALFIHFFRSRLSNPDRVAPELPLFPSDFGISLDLFRSINTAFFSHPFVSSIARDMERPTRTRTVALPYIANAICAVVTFAVPLVGYLSGANCPLDDMIFLYFDASAPEVTIGKIALLILSLMSSAFFTWELARRIANLIVPGSDESRYTVLLAGFGIMCTYIALNMLTGLPRELFFALGNIGNSLLAFVLPPFFYMVQFKAANVQWFLISLTVFVIGGVIVVMTVIEMIKLISG